MWQWGGRVVINLSSAKLAQRVVKIKTMCMEMMVYEGPCVSSLSSRSHLHVRFNYKKYGNGYLPAQRYVPHNKEPIRDTLLLGESKYSTNSGRKIPKEYPIPSTIMLHTKEEATITHPHPPSGGVGIRLLTLPSDSAETVETRFSPLTFSPFAFPFRASPFFMTGKVICKFQE